MSSNSRSFFELEQAVILFATETGSDHLTMHQRKARAFAVPYIVGLAAAAVAGLAGLICLFVAATTVLGAASG